MPQNPPITASQRAQLADTLQSHRRALEHQRDVRLTLQSDPDGAVPRAGDQDVDATLSNLDTQALGAVIRAINRIEGDDYGLCADCGQPIPYVRLNIEPQATRCVACESRHEREGLK